MRLNNCQSPVLLLLTMLSAGCTNLDLAGEEAALQRTWSHGQHLVPPAALRAGQFSSIAEIREHPDDWAGIVARQKLKPGVRLAAVIYLHGCAGNNNGLAWWSQFRTLGFAHFAPDSLARPRDSLCDQGRMTTERIPLRMQEIRYALGQLRGLDWIDQKKLVLVGFSEGAQAAAAYTGDEFAAIVLIGTDCRFSGGSPRAGSDVAVLSLMGANDRYYDGVGCRITRKVGGSRSVVIERAEHNLRNNRTAVAELREFLSRVLAEHE